MLARGLGTFKIDWALDGPVPWLAEECRQAGVVHVGDSVRTMSKAVWEAFYGLLPARPTLILGQQSLADPSRAPGCTAPAVTWPPGRSWPTSTEQVAWPRRRPSEGPLSWRPGGAAGDEPPSRTDADNARGRSGRRRKNQAERQAGRLLQLVGYVLTWRPWGHRLQHSGCAGRPRRHPADATGVQVPSPWPAVTIGVLAIAIPASSCQPGPKSAASTWGSGLGSRPS